jgi:hypothetical protein
LGTRRLGNEEEETEFGNEEDEKRGAHEKIFLALDAGSLLAIPPH